MASDGDRITVMQDGRVFFDDRSCDELFESSVLVEDGDVSAARLAREEFADWAARRGITFDWA